MSSQNDQDLSSYDSQHSLAPENHRLLEIPQLPRFELVKGLSGAYGRKLSSLYVIDQEICEMPFFNFEDRRKPSIKEQQHDGERSQNFWAKISQNVLTPYLPNNRILLNKYLDLQKQGVRNLQTKNHKTPMSFMKLKSQSRNQLESFRLKKKRRLPKKFDNINHSFELPKKPDFFSELSEDFRRKSVYNSYEGEMTRKQAKFYKLFVGVKNEELSCSIDLQDNQEKKPSILKKEALQGRKNSTKKINLTLLSYLKNKPNEKKLNFLLNGKDEKDITLKDLPIIEIKEKSPIPMKNNESEIRSKPLIVDHIEKKPSEHTISEKLSPMSASTMSFLNKKNTFSFDQSNILNPRKTMPNLIPNALELKLLERNKIQKKAEKPQHKKELETIIQKINGNFPKKKEKVAINSSNSSSIWTDRSELKSLKDYKKKVFNSFQCEKKKKRQKSNFKPNQQIELSPVKVWCRKNNIQRMQESLEADSRCIHIFGQLPKRKDSKSAREIAKELYGFDSQKSKGLSGFSVK